MLAGIRGSDGAFDWGNSQAPNEDQSIRGGKYSSGAHSSITPWRIPCAETFNANLRTIVLGDST